MICSFLCHYLLTIRNFTPFISLMHNDLQVEVDRLTNWARLWQLQITVSKCSAFRIFNLQWKIAEVIVNKSYSIDGSILPLADCIPDLGVYHDCRLKYDQHISIIVHSAYKRAVLIPKRFHSRDPQTLKCAYCVYVRPLLEFFSSHIWSPHYKYLVDKIESVQTYFTNRLFTGKLSGHSKLSYFSRLKILGLETLERRRLINNLVLYYKILNSHCDLVLNVALGSSVTRGNNFKHTKQTCSIDVACYVIGSSCVLVYMLCAMTLSETVSQPRGGQRTRDSTLVSCRGHSCVPVGQCTLLQ